MSNTHINFVSSTLTVEGSSYACVGVGCTLEAGALPRFTITLAEANSSLNTNTSLNLLSAENIRSLATTIQNLMLSATSLTPPLKVSVSYSAVKGTAKPVSVNVALFPVNCTLNYNSSGILNCTIIATSETALINVLNPNVYVTHVNPKVGQDFKNNNDKFWVNALDKDMFEETNKIDIMKFIKALLNVAESNYEPNTTSTKDFNAVAVANLEASVKANSAVFKTVMRLIDSLGSAMIYPGELPSIPKCSIQAICNYIHSVLFSTGLLFNNILTICTEFNIDFFPAAITGGALDLTGKFSNISYTRIAKGESDSTLTVIPSDFTFRTGSTIVGSIYPSRVTYTSDPGVVGQDFKLITPYYASYPTSTTRLQGRYVVEEAPYWCIPSAIPNKDSTAKEESKIESKTDKSNANTIPRGKAPVIAKTDAKKVEEETINKNVIDILKVLAENLYWKLLLSDSTSSVVCSIENGSSVCMGDIVTLKADNSTLLKGILSNIQLQYSAESFQTGFEFMASVYPGVALK